MSVLGVFVLFFRGIFREDYLPLALGLIPVAFLGKAIGTAMLKRISDRAFRMVTLGVVILTGTLGVATAAWALL
jgi:uncharacterized membrane protein YfcA